MILEIKLDGNESETDMKTNMNDKAGRGALGFVFSVVLLDVMGLGLLLPIQAYIVRQYSDQALMVAMIPVLYATAQFFAAPLLGKVSDRFGRRPVILYSISAGLLSISGQSTIGWETQTPCFSRTVRYRSLHPRFAEHSASRV